MLRGIDLFRFDEKMRAEPTKFAFFLRCMVKSINTVFRKQTHGNLVRKFLKNYNVVCRRRFSMQISCVYFIKEIEHHYRLRIL